MVSGLVSLPALNGAEKFELWSHTPPTPPGSYIGPRRGYGGGGGGGCQFHSYYTCLHTFTCTVPHAEPYMEEGRLVLVIRYHVILYTYIVCLNWISTWRMDGYVLSYYILTCSPQML